MLGELKAQSVGERILYCADMLYFNGITTEGERAKIIKRLRRDSDVRDYLNASGEVIPERAALGCGYRGRKK